MSSSFLPPRRRPVQLDSIFDHGTGWQVIPCAPAFDGQNLVYACRSDTARIDPRSGRLHVPTGRPNTNEIIQVQASNGTGTAEIEIQVTIEDDGVRAETSRTRRLEIDEVTFLFDRPVEVGHFIGGAGGVGDPFVVGPVRLLDYAPGPRLQSHGDRQRAINGAMLNPPCSRKTGFDGLAPHDSYDPDLNAGLRLPLDLQPGDSLIVSRSNPNFPDDDGTMLHGFVVLSCLTDPPFEDSFRPPFTGTDPARWRLSDIRTDRLPQLAPSGSGMAALDRTALEARFDRFAVDFIPTWNRRHLNTPTHPILYGRDVCSDEALPYLWVGTERPLEDKARILYGLVQRSIDRYAVFRSALEQGFRPWGANGGHNSGRKFSILFGGHLLDDPGMVSIMDQLEAVEGGFQEDEMTFYVSDLDVEITNGPDWNPQYPDRLNAPYTPGMVGMPEWRGQRAPERATAAWTGHPYRIAGNANTQHAQVLMCMAMGLRDAWGNEAYFDYHMRYTEIMAGRPDPFRFRGGTQALYNPVPGSRPAEGWEDWTLYWQDPAAYAMLMAHRDTFYSYPWA